MPYESLQNELERRLGRKAEFQNQEETLDFRSENWSGNEEGQLAKALAKARERAKQVRKPLKIERLPHRDQLSLKDFEKRASQIFQAEMECPPATQDVAINTKNRNATIKNFDYGPLNVDEPGDYWKNIAKRWKTTEKALKNPHVEIVSLLTGLLGCKPVCTGETSDGEGVLGYCWMHHFKCHSARTCDTWAKGGPITTDKVSEGWQERAFGGSKESKRTKKGGKEKAKAAESFNVEYPLTVEGYDVVIYHNEVDEDKFSNKVGDFRLNLRRRRLVARDERELLDTINELIQSEIGDVPTYEASNFEFYHKDYFEELNESIIITDVLAIWDSEEGIYFYPTEDEIEQWRNGNQEIYTFNFVFELVETPQILVPNLKMKPSSWKDIDLSVSRLGIPQAM